MTQTLTTEAMQEIYEAAVHSEATGDDQDAHFELLCKLEDVGGTNATIRKLIDMVRAANREAQPVTVVPDGKTITPFFDTIALDTARDIMCDVVRRDDFLGGDTQLLARIQCRIDSACRASMVTAPVRRGCTVVPIGWIDCRVKLPDGAKGIWSNEVAAVSNLGDVFKLSCMGGYWQRTAAFIESGATSITHWIPLPPAPEVDHA
jgi:hypothetical protein